MPPVTHNAEAAARSGPRLSLRAISRWAPLLLGLAVAVPAHAQTMFKCENAAGKIEYSDRPCWSGTEVKRMTPTGGPTKEEIERVRMRAAVQEREAQQTRKAAQAQPVAPGANTVAGAAPKDGQGAQGTPGNPPQGASGRYPPTRSAAVQAEADRALRNDKARLLAPATPSVTTVAPRPAPAGPSAVTTCDAGGCWDSSGQRYTASGPSLVRSDGRVCQQVGSTLTCN